MAHSHSVYDDDKRYIVDPETRAIKSESGKETVVVQNDHNSEELVIMFPKIIEGHDMSEVDVVEVHYENTGNGTSVSNRNRAAGRSYIDNVTPTEHDPQTLVCNWLIPQKATQFAGTTKFKLKFICFDDGNENLISYVWNTDTCSNIKVLPTIEGGEGTGEVYPDIIMQLEKKINDLNDKINKFDGNTTDPGEGGGCYLDDGYVVLSDVVAINNDGYIILSDNEAIDENGYIIL